MNPLVSIIITTKNEEKNIGLCLNAILNQTYPKESIEIIVVDNNSTDRTKEIADKYTDKIYNCGPERSAQRNFGVKKAGGKYILYLDSDMLLSEKVVQECVSKCESNNYTALFIPEKIIGKGFWVKVRNFERSFYDATVIDCVRFVRKDKFLEIGGFDRQLTGPEDWDFDRRIRDVGKVSIINAYLLHNEHIFNLRDYLKKKAYYSKTFNQYIAKWGKNDDIIKKQLGFYYRYIGVFTENGKWKRLIKHPLLTIGMYFLRIMIGILYKVKSPIPTYEVGIGDFYT